jgi:hypothetical protein
MAQGDSWDEPTLLPTPGAALDVRPRARKHNTRTPRMPDEGSGRLSRGARC